MVDGGGGGLSRVFKYFSNLASAATAAASLGGSHCGSGLWLASTSIITASRPVDLLLLLLFPPLFLRFDNKGNEPLSDAVEGFGRDDDDDDDSVDCPVVNVVDGLDDGKDEDVDSGADVDEDDELDLETEKKLSMKDFSLDCMSASDSALPFF